MSNDRPAQPAHVTYDPASLIPDSTAQLSSNELVLHSTKIGALEHAVRKGHGYAPWVPGQTLDEAIAAFANAPVQPPLTRTRTRKPKNDEPAPLKRTDPPLVS